MDKVAVTKIQTSKNSVKTGEKITIKVYAYSITQDPLNERLAFALGSEKPKL